VHKVVRSAAFGGTGSASMPRFGSPPCAAPPPCAASAVQSHIYQAAPPFGHQHHAAAPVTVMPQPWAAAAKSFAPMAAGPPVRTRRSLTAHPSSSKMSGDLPHAMSAVPMFPPNGPGGPSGVAERFVSWTTTNHIQTTTAYSSYGGDFVQVETSMQNQACAYSHSIGATATTASAVPTQASMSTLKAVDTDVPDSASATGGGPLGSGSAGTYGPIATNSANASTVLEVPVESHTPSTARTLMPWRAGFDQGAHGAHRFDANAITPSSGTSRTLVPDGFASFFGWSSQPPHAADDAGGRMMKTSHSRSDSPACTAASAVLEFAQTIASTFTFGGSRNNNNNNVAALPPPVVPSRAVNPPTVTFNISPRTHARLQAGGQLTESEIVRIMRGVSSDGVSFHSETATSLSTASNKWFGCMTAQTTESGGWFRCMPIASIRSLESLKPNKREKRDRRGRRSCGCCQ